MTHEVFEKKYMTHLNEQQREATQAVDGAVLLLAVPGSGKTTVLVTRLGYMVYCCGIVPRSILTMTYTTAATIEMKQRFASMFGNQYADDMEFRTINGISSKIINYYSQNHGKRQAFELLENEGELSKIIRQIYQQVNDEYPEDSTVKDIRTNITYTKNMMLSGDEIEKLDVGVDRLPEIYQQYNAELKRRGVMDYDDQMTYALTILNNYPSVLNNYQDAFRYICVDESQDTSKIQHAIIKLLAQKNNNIFMVGDEDQSIYGFRAAYPEALLSFSNDYPNTKVLLMEYNYRSTEEIVSAANAFVTMNQFRYEKTIIATRGSGLLIQKIITANRMGQYKYLFAVAQNCTKETAVLYRNNDSALPLIDMFERNGIDYNCRKFDEVFFSHRIIVDITDIINFAYNPKDEQIFMRIYYKFDSPISKNAAIYACQQSRRSGKPILEELRYFPDMKNYAKDTLIELMMMLSEIPKDSAETAINRIWYGMRYGQYVTKKKIDTGKYQILCMLGKNEPSAVDLLRRLQRLKEIIQNHNNSKSTKFVLSTVHSSKGLEYDCVYLLDIYDGVMPPKNANEAQTPEEIRQSEEERRLYYVAMTRAKNELNLFVFDKPSSFTSEVMRSLPIEVIDETDIFASLKRNLCERTYTDKIEGRGKIIAQRGESMLIEYENRKLQILTISTMFENRDTTSKYVNFELETPQVSSPSRQALRDSSKVEHAITNIPIGSNVNHITFGNGVVTDVDKDVISIRFDGANSSKRFGLSMAIKNGFLKLSM